ncbi:MAG: ABC transporter permease [Polyangiaceae bacterium]|jgi:ABC-type dipeptide/oligopeptide/nickel transport system permease subunit|nr:ABC transporter permease [Polyangiaceae bacterium]
MIPARPLARFRRKRAALLAAAAVAALSILALVGPALVPHSPNLSDFTHGRGPLGLPAGPSAAHWLGTDTLYRDLLSRLLHGGRVSLLVGLAATTLATAIGASVGLLTGYVHQTRLHALDSLLMRVVDAGLSFPYLLFVMALGALLDRTDVSSIILILGATGWLGTSRLVRAKTIQIRDLDFVLAARALGQRPLPIILRHVLPNIAGPLIVTASASVASMILAESVLSYLSVGVQPPTATWGRMLREGQTYLTAAPRLVAVPGLAILFAVMAFNMLGEAIRDALDPHAA